MPMSEQRRRVVRSVAASRRARERAEEIRLSRLPGAALQGAGAEEYFRHRRSLPGDIGPDAIKHDIRFIKVELRRHGCSAGRDALRHVKYKIQRHSDFPEIAQELTGLLRGITRKVEKSCQREIKVAAKRPRVTDIHAFPTHGGPHLAHLFRRQRR